MPHLNQTITNMYGTGQNQFHEAPYPIRRTDYDMRYIQSFSGNPQLSGYVPETMRENYQVNPHLNQTMGDVYQYQQSAYAAPPTMRRTPYDAEMLAITGSANEYRYATTENVGRPFVNPYHVRENYTGPSAPRSTCNTRPLLSLQDTDNPASYFRI